MPPTMAEFDLCQITTGIESSCDGDWRQSSAPNRDEDEDDIAAALESLAEPGESIPHETVLRNLGLE